MADGRWPANVILSPEMAEILDGQSGYQKDGVTVSRNKDPNALLGNQVYGARKNGARDDHTYGSGGGASRYFLNAGYEPWELEWIYSVGLRPYGTEQK